MLRDFKKIKLIRSSTMKCRLNKDIVAGTFNAPSGSLGRVIYERKEHEGTLFLMEDFSILKERDKDIVMPGVGKSIQRFKAPISVRWDITYLCNFQCRHCYSDCSPAGINSLSTQEAKRLLDIFDDAKVQFVQILGGEPMVRKDIFELVKHALDKRYIFSLNSNGFLLNEHATYRLAELGLKYIQISLHGFESEHEYLTTKKGSFGRAVEVIKSLIKAGVSVSVSCVVSDINSSNTIRFLNYLIESGVKNIQLLTPLNEGRAKEQKIVFDQKDSVLLKAKLLAFKQDNPSINIDLPGFDIDLIDGLANRYVDDPEYEFMFGCSGGVSSLRVNPEGKAAVCVGEAGVAIGDLLEESIEVIMENMYKWRLENMPPMCVGCPYYLNECQGGCYLRFNKNANRL